jgi:hypothetical protein
MTLYSGLTISPGWLPHIVNGASEVCDQKTFKFFVSHQEESMGGHMGTKGVY